VTAPESPSAGRVAALYTAVAAAVAIAIAIAIAVGPKLSAEGSIAGGYDLANPDTCLGASFDIEQSGRYVGVSDATGDLGGQLELEDGRLSGEVSCRDGSSAPLEASAEGGAISGTIDGRALEAGLRRDPPDPGAPQRRIPDSIAGEYALAPRSPCLGGQLELEEAGPDLVHMVVDGREVGELRYEEGSVSGEVACPGGGEREVGGEAANRSIELTLRAPGAEATERVSATLRREPGSLVAHFLVAVAAVMLAARLLGMAALRLRQPRVMGEVLAGIALGPTLLGALSPGVQAELFPQDVVPYIGVVAQLGLVFYMFLVGLEIDLGQLRGRVRQVAAISNASVALPMALGLALAVPIYELVGPDTKFAAFALFMGVSMSVTAFPVLARILIERRMLKRPLGALTLACAAVDDVTAWFLIALATAVAVAGSGTDVLETIVLAVVFCLVMALAVRPLLARVSAAFDEAGRVPAGWVALIFAGVLLSAYATEEIGIALIFGAFVMGLIMPRHADLTEDVTRRLEDFVVLLLLPLFFAYTGLRTNIGLLDRPELWLIGVAALAVAVAGKLGGATIAARLMGFDWRSSTVIGTLMNTRGLTELIVLNLALEKGVISQALFAILVLMALVTTFAAGPALNLLDPKNELGEPLEQELVDARRMSMAEFPGLEIPDQAILIAPQAEGALAQLRSLAEPLALSEPPRELIVARLVRPPRAAEVRGGLQTENKLLGEASNEVQAARAELVARGIAARAVAFSSADPGADLARLALSEEVSLLLIDGRRPLLGEGVPRGDVGEVLREAPCDVGVLVAKEGTQVLPGPEAAVVVPFGGAEHDWAALELGAWMAAATGAPLRLLGAAGDTDERARVSRLLGDAGLLVQQYAGVPAKPVVAEPGREGVVEAAASAGLLAIGLSSRWREEGLGPTRSEIARAAPAPVLFVRRGSRPGALAPPEDVTRFTWSAAGVGARFKPGQPL
jgi:Kef-type K+ transport system membrane component KefB/nucleotide-binding universal stress UspA family protein